MDLCELENAPETQRCPKTLKKYLAFVPENDNKQLLDEGFVIFRIINVEVSVSSRAERP